MDLCSMPHSSPPHSVTAMISAAPWYFSLLQCHVLSSPLQPVLVPGRTRRALPGSQGFAGWASGRPKRTGNTSDHAAAALDANSEFKSLPSAQITMIFFSKIAAGFVCHCPISSKSLAENWQTETQTLFLSETKIKIQNVPNQSSDNLLLPRSEPCSAWLNSLLGAGHEEHILSWSLLIWYLWRWMKPSSAIWPSASPASYMPHFRAPAWPLKGRQYLSQLNLMSPLEIIVITQSISSVQSLAISATFLCNVSTGIENITWNKYAPRLTLTSSNSEEVSGDSLSLTLGNSFYLYHL